MMVKIVMIVDCRRSKRLLFIYGKFIVDLITENLLNKTAALGTIKYRDLSYHFCYASWNQCSTPFAHNVHQKPWCTKIDS